MADPNQGESSARRESQRRSQSSKSSRARSRSDDQPEAKIGESSVAVVLDGFKVDRNRTLGEGSYASVCYAHHVETAKLYACKIINEKKDMGNFIERFLPRELKILRKLNSDRVTCVHGIFKMQHQFYIVMDHCENGDLLRYLQKKGHALDEDEVRAKTLQMMLAVKYLHDDMNIAHRDLKCENILIDGRGRLKLGDFGFARSCQPGIETTEADQAETKLIKEFMASESGSLPLLKHSRRLTEGQSAASELARLDRMPRSSSGNGFLVRLRKSLHSIRVPLRVLQNSQLIGKSTIDDVSKVASYRSSTPLGNKTNVPNGQPVNSMTFCGSVAYAAPEVLSRKAYEPKRYDMWSAGVIVFIMACFFMPFDDSDQPKMVRRQLAKKWRYPPETKLSDVLKEFLEGLMEPSPKDRLTVNDALRHKWLRRAYREYLQDEQKKQS